MANLVLASPALAQYFPTPPREVSRGESPSPQALRWLEQQKASVPARDFELLRRGQATRLNAAVGVIPRIRQDSSEYRL